MDCEKEFGGNSLNISIANRMIENCIGVLQIPLGIACNFLINGKEYIIPMATEEPSVIAASIYIYIYIKINS